MLYLSEYTPTTSKEDKITEHELGRRLLSQGLEQEYGRTWEVCVEEKGKPFLKSEADIFFNISHTKGLVVCGISEREIGVDVERIRKFREAVVRKACSKKEQEYVFSATDDSEKARRFCKLWTLKESYIKAIGKGLAFPMDEITFEFIDEKICSNISGWSYEQFPYGDEYMIAVCREHAEKRKSMTYEEIVAKVKEIFKDADVSGIQEHLAYQFNITGEGEGAFYAEVKEGQLYVEPYEYYDRDAIFVCSAKTLFKIIEGKLDPVAAFTIGKLKVEGDIDKALKLKEFI